MEHAVSLKIIVLNFIAFFILLFVIWNVVWPKLNAFIEARQKKIEDLLKTYQERNDEVNDLLAKVKKESEEATLHRTKFLEDAKHESEKLRQDIIDKAYNESQSMIDRAKIEISQERKVMFSELRENVSRMVVGAVENILGKVIDQDLDKKIIIETEKAVSIIPPHET